LKSFDFDFLFLFEFIFISSFSFFFLKKILSSLLFSSSFQR